VSTYRIEIDRSLCSGFGSCVKEAPGVIELNAGGVAMPLVAETDDEAVLDAAGSCPMGAIIVYDLSSGEQAA
jgi:ferredoxin